MKRIKSFAWRAGLYVCVSLAAYTVNLADIREIELYKLGTIFVVTLSAYILSEGTKALNK